MSEFVEYAQKEVIPTFRKAFLKNPPTSFEEWKLFFNTMTKKDDICLWYFNNAVLEEYSPLSIIQIENFLKNIDQEEWFAIGAGIAHTAMGIIYDAKNSTGFDEEFKNVNFDLIMELVAHLSTQIIVRDNFSKLELFFMWTTLGALTEAFSMIFLIFNKDSYEKTKKNNIINENIKSIKNKNPSQLKFSSLKGFIEILCNEKILNDIFCTEFLPKIIDARNHIHLVKKNAISKSFSETFDLHEFKKMLIIYFEFLKEVESKKPDIENPNREY